MSEQRKTIRKRRGRGEGAIYFVESRNEWLASASYGTDPETGKRIRRTIYGGSKREVEQRLVDLRIRTAEELARGRAPTVREFIQGWLEREVKPKLRASTHKSYAGIASRHILPILGAMRVNVVAPANIARVLGIIQERAGASAAGKARTLLHRVFRRAVALEKAARNPVSAIEAPHMPKKEMAFLDAAQVAQLFEAAKGDRLEALAIVLALTGVRLGEALALQWSDVNFDHRELRISKQSVEVTGERKSGVVGTRAILPPKTDKGRRTIALSAAAAGALKRRLKLAEREALARPSDLIFPSSTGSVISKSNLHRRWWRPLLTRAKLPTIRIHDLRHSSASLSLAAGTNTKIVADRLGHTSPAFTQRAYQHAVEQLHRADADAIALLVGKETRKRQAGRKKP